MNCEQTLGFPGQRQIVERFFALAGNFCRQVGSLLGGQVGGQYFHYLLRRFGHVAVFFHLRRMQNPGQTYRTTQTTYARPGGLMQWCWSMILLNLLCNCCWGGWGFRFRM